MIVFCDTETTGLDPDQHEIWEVGLIAADGSEHQWQLPVDLARADSRALTIGGFFDRSKQIGARDGGTRTTYDIVDFCRNFRILTHGCHLAGAVISFDEERLRKLLRANGECPMWHYHLVDVEALAAGKLGQEPPWDSEDLSRRVGVDPGDYVRHSALGDARWAKAIYEAVMGPEE